MLIVQFYSLFVIRYSLFNTKLPTDYRYKFEYLLLFKYHARHLYVQYIKYGQRYGGRQVSLHRFPANKSWAGILVGVVSCIWVIS